MWPSNVLKLDYMNVPMVPKNTSHYRGTQLLCSMGRIHTENFQKAGKGVGGSIITNL